VISGRKNRKLNPEQIKKVDECVLQILEEFGCSVQCEEAVDILNRAGCDVSDPKRVKIPRKVVREALEAAPDEIRVYNRSGELAMHLKPWNCYYGTGSDCVSTYDLYTRKRKRCKKEDVENLARFCEALPNIDFVMSFGIANDAPGGTNFVHQYDAMLRNTRKPVIVTGHGRNDMQAMIDMAACAGGGVDKLREKPSLILYTEPLSPMIHTEMGVSKGLICCENEIPFIYIGSPYMGATAPASLEGILVQTVAESLSGLVIFQSKRPGAKFIFGGDATVMDPQSTIFSYGSPELNVLNACLADMAHYYELPFFCIAGATDSKILDTQAGLEYAVSIYNATVNGCNIIHDCGYLESGLTSSFESVLFADEAISMVKYMMRDLEFDDESVPLELMKKVGPGGHFLTEDHTARNFRKRFWFPRVLDRKQFEGWESQGSKDLLEVLNERSKKIFEGSSPQQPAPDILKGIDDILKSHKPDV
jgi:trimethylamine--corrinoid protein Co-methyltransferase